MGCDEFSRYLKLCMEFFTLVTLLALAQQIRQVSRVVWLQRSPALTFTLGVFPSLASPMPTPAVRVLTNDLLCWFKFIFGFLHAYQKNVMYVPWTTPRFARRASFSGMGISNFQCVSCALCFA